MNRNAVFFCAIGAIFAFAPNLTAAENASTAIPRGDVSKHEFNQSEIFPGTKRIYTLYVPKQCDPSKPACVYVSQDGLLYNAPAVFDQLIHEKTMPVTVGVFVTPGNALGRDNRSFEYDSMTDDYVRFLTEELLPFIAKTHKLNLSTHGNDRAIAGISSGGICAFTAAWTHPEAFSRVFSNVGSFVSHRGGYVYPSLVRKVEPKPIRVFLEDGSNDLKFAFGDWFLANQEMEQALTFAGYEVTHSWSDNGHDAKHATKIFPEAMQWLWKDWPRPIKAGSSSPYLQEIVMPGESWKSLPGHYGDATSPTANADGDVFFCDAPNNKIYKIDSHGAVNAFVDDSKLASGLAIGPTAILYATGNGRITAYDAQGGIKTDVAAAIPARRLAVTSKGNVYATVRDSNNAGQRGVLLVTRQGVQRIVDSHLKEPASVAITADQRFLCVTDSDARCAFSYLVQPDGTLADKEPYYYLHNDTVDSCADGVCVDRNNRVYVATTMGVQVCMPTGQTQCILPTPNGKVTGLCLGGRQFDVLYATCGHKVFQRKLQVQGFPVK